MTKRLNNLSSVSPKTITTLSTVECEKLLSFICDRISDCPQLFLFLYDYLMFNILLFTGVRVGELVKLTFSDLFYNNFPVKSLIIRAEIAKNHRERTIPICESFHATLLLFSNKLDITRQGPIFDYSIRQVQRIVERICLAAIGRRVHPHVFRHTFATRLMRVTNAGVVQQLLGHYNLTSTQIYTHPNSTDLQEAVNKM